jgi:hypothetical protein
VPPVPRPIPLFAAEPPQEPLPYGRWEEALYGRFADAAETEIGAATWFPDRTFAGRTYVPATAPAEGGGEVFGYVSYTREHEGAEAVDFQTVADFTEETADENPDWSLDLSDQEIGHWRGPQGRRGLITLVWGVALVGNGAVATTELGPSTTDQCELADDRFTLVSLDAYTGDYIEVRLWGTRGAELARESLYEDD